MKKFLMIICAAMIFLTGCSNEPPIAVTTEKVISAENNLTLTHEGTISTSNELKIFSPVSGNVLEKYFDDSSDIEEGQKLFKIGAQQYAMELSQKKAELSEAMTTLAKKMSELADKKVSAQEFADIVDRKFAVEELQAEIAELQRRVKEMEKADADGVIYALKSGRPGANVIKIGMPVTANETILATIGNADPAAVNFEISEAEKQILSASDNLKISLKLNDGTTYPHGGSIKIFGEIAEVTFDNPAGSLIIGTPAQIEFGNLKISNKLLVPEIAIQKNGMENFVYVDDNKKAAVKKILLGDKVGAYFIVKEGLKADDLIITDNFKNLREGASLDVANAK